MVRRKLVTQETYDRILAAQDGGCAICGALPAVRDLAVDHDHKTGAVRGLLCMSCNTGLGHFHDDPELLDKAMEYLSDSRLTHTLTRTDELLIVMHGEFK